ncbi:MAG: endonuclease dU [Candidatus Nezhaarchaeales archaeon]
MRLLGVEDGSFSPQKFQRKGKTILCAVLMEDFRIEDIALRLIDVDGLDATEKLLDMAKNFKMLDAIILGGITFAGFNLVDPIAVHAELKVPIIIVTDEKPDNQAVLDALKKHFEDWKQRYEVFERLAEVSPIYEAKLNPKENPTYIEVVGLEFQKALEILRRITVRGRIPEPVRIASRIAKALSKALLE